MLYVFFLHHASFGTRVFVFTQLSALEKFNKTYDERLDYQTEYFPVQTDNGDYFEYE